VFGDLSGSGFGGFAQYVCAREDVLALKYDNMTFEEAAAVPQAGVLAVQGLHKGKIQKGKKILINGAGGGVGTFAVQIAKSFGAEVTGVDSTRKLDMLLSMGADHVIDYTKEDFTKSGQIYDLILDVVVYRSIFDYKRALGPKGIFVMIGGSIPRIFQIALTAPLITRSKKLVILAHRPNPKDLIFINDLFEAGKVKPVIDRCYPLHEVPEALRYFGEGHHQGKIVITLEHKNKT
jgi:NADPH:quinone reductase-like Zn-dependent oxidoreductase